MVSKADVDKLLADDSLPSVPAAVSVGGAGGPRPDQRYVSEPNMRRRREAVANLLISGLSRDRIIGIMSQVTVKDAKGNSQAGFGMTEREIDRAIANVRAEWEEEAAEVKRYAKDTAVRRLLREISEAQRDGAHGAIANLEKVLMLVQGTAEPTDIPQPTDSRITDALLRILGEKDPLAIREYVERERVREIESGGRDVPLLTDGIPTPKKG